MKNNLCIQSHGQSKALVGADIANIFEFIAPIPLAQAPEGVLTMDGVDQPVTFVGEEPITITALTDGRRRLSLESAPTLALTASRGAAFVVSDSICWPCSIQKFSTEGTQTVAYLTDSLPASLPQGETCMLYFCYYSGTLPVCDYASGPHRLDVTYSALERFGGNDVKQLYFIQYVHQIFSTGLTESDVRAYFKSNIPNASLDAGVSSALVASEDWLVDRIRYELRETGQTEDDILAPQNFRRAQLLYAAAHSFLLTDSARFEALKKEANFAFKSAASAVFIDRDHDGTPEPKDPTALGKHTHDVGYHFQSARRRRR